MLLTVISQTADILGVPQEPQQISDNDSQLLYGEQFQVEESHGAYVYGYSVHDNYKVYVEREQLVKNAPKSNSIITNKFTHLYPEPDFKSRPDLCLSFMSQLTAMEETKDGFTQLDTGSWVYTEHISPLKDFKMPEDIAQTATLFLGSPYLYGGRSVFGLDCSALVQLVVASHGYNCPARDTKDQIDSFKTSGDKEKLERNDIVYFKGHVGIMMDDRYIINATSRHMCTVIEDVRDLEKIYGGITHVAKL